MWRACRLVVDHWNAFHALTAQQAIDFMMANTALTKQNIEVEVDRYISWPGRRRRQDRAIEILELRKLAEQGLAGFDYTKIS